MNKFISLIDTLVLLRNNKNVGVFFDLKFQKGFLKFQKLNSITMIECL